MKKCLIILLVFLLTACGQVPKEQSITTPTETTITTTTVASETANEPIKMDITKEQLDAMLPHDKEAEKVFLDGMPGLEIDGTFNLVKFSKGEFDPETFRKYFYGKWETSPSNDRELLINDTEKCNRPEDSMKGYVYNFSENTIGVPFINGGLVEIAWIDKNNPETLYFACDLHFYTTHFRIPYKDVIVYKKTAIAAENNDETFLSPLAIEELAHEYGFPSSLATTIDHEGYIRTTPIWKFPIYLLEKSKEKIMLKTRVASTENGEDKEIFYSIEKKNEEWTQVFDFDFSITKAQLDAMLPHDQETLSTKLPKVELDGTFNVAKGVKREFEPETFRKYFYGKWETGHPYGRELLIDDTVKCNMPEVSMKGYVGNFSEDIIATLFINGGIGEMFWIDKNDPDTLYFINELPYAPEEYLFVYYRDVMVYKKTASAPENTDPTFLSSLVLEELAREYGFPAYLATEIEYDDYFRTSQMWTFSIYLTDKSKNKICFKSTIINVDKRKEKEVFYRVEKINGEWVQIIDAVDLYKKADEQDAQKMSEVLFNDMHTIPNAEFNA